MMAGQIVLAEQIRGQVREASLDALAAAVELKGAVGGPVAVALVAGEPAAYVGALRRPGVDEVILVSAGSDAFDPGLAAPVLEGLIRERSPRLVLLGRSVNAPAVGAAVAAHLGLGFASDVVEVQATSDGLTARREILGGKVQVDLDFPANPGVVVVLRAGDRRGLAESGVDAPAVTLVDLAAGPRPARSRHLGYEDAPATTVDLSRAPFLLTIGRGIGERDKVALFEELAGKAGAVICSSRPLVDAGWMPRDRQVGQSGATVKPAVYLAFGVSGANEHLAGMKGSGTIIAVNTDPRARIFTAAHFGAVADACEVAEELLKAL